MSTVVGFSPSSLASFKDCARCFWLEKNTKLRRPEGIKASLPNGMDRIMKAYVDGIVARGDTVLWLRMFEGMAFPFKDRVKLKQFMHWTTFQRSAPYKGTILKAWAGVDDVIEHTDGKVSPWDFKTKATEPDESYGERYYQTQLDMIHFILEGHGLKCTGYGVLSYGWPKGIDDEGQVLFGWKNLMLRTDPERALEWMLKATHCLEGPCPLPAETCDYCKYVGARTPAAWL